MRFTGTEYAIGPRVDYFTGQQISVTTVSTGGGNQYTEFAQVDYLDPMIVPGIEVSFMPDDFPFVFRYAYLLPPEGRGPMHMVGLTYLLSGL